MFYIRSCYPGWSCVQHTWCSPGVFKDLNHSLKKKRKIKTIFSQICCCYLKIKLRSSTHVTWEGGNLSKCLGFGIGSPGCTKEVLSEKWYEQRNSFWWSLWLFILIMFVTQHCFPWTLSLLLSKHKASPILDSSMLLAIIVLKYLSSWLKKDLT